MNRPTIEWLVATLKAACSTADLNQPIHSISIDSRLLQTGDLFWAIKANRDGHEFVGNAFSKGASFAVVSKEWGQTDTAARFHHKLIQVDDTFDALTLAASAWRQKLQIPIIAITGSNGKTSTKDILVHLLRSKYKTMGTSGNRNNELGLPLSLLSISRDDKIAVIEMGAAKQGDIAYLCKIAEPTHGLLTSISIAHLAGFKTIEGVAKTKGELYDYLSDNGFGFVPVEDPRCVKQAEVLSQKRGFGFSNPPDNWTDPYLQAADYRVNENGCGSFTLHGKTVLLPYPGKPVAQAALAAMTIADHFNVSLEESIHRISAVSLTSGRMSLIHIGKITVLDDSYNANPSSMQAALETLKLMPGQNKSVIFGDMNELGDYTEAAHKELGRQVADLNPVVALFVGPLSRSAEVEARALGANSAHFESLEELEPKLHLLLTNTDVLLIKASRNIGLDRIPTLLKRLLF